MKVKNTLALPTALAFGKNATCEPFLSFIVKGTFCVDTDGLPARLSPVQLPVLEADEPYDPKKPGGLLRYESDRIPFKPRSDVVLIGCAHAPGGRPVRVLDVGIRVGKLDKTLRVIGDRWWSFPSLDQLEPVMGKPASFTQMPLTYDRAFGGVDEAAQADPERTGIAPWCGRNWFGRGFVACRTVASIDRRALPNVEDPDIPVVSWDSRPKPAGCAFFPRNSEPRIACSGTYDDAWRARRAPELPEDFRFDAFNGADPDLQIDGYLVGSEPVTLTNVDPKRPTLSFHLPCLKPVLTVEAQEGDAQGGGARTALAHVIPLLDTLVFVPDDGIFYQVWRAVIPIRDPDALDVREIRVDYELLPVPQHARAAVGPRA